MATLREKGGIIYIQYYNPLTKKTTSKSTGLIASKENYSKAREKADDLQKYISSNFTELKSLGIKTEVTIAEAFNHLKRNNQHKQPKTIADYDRFYKKFTEDFPGHIACSSLNKLNVESWLSKIKTLKLSQNTIHGYGKQLNHFLNFLFEYSYTAPFRINKAVKTRPEVKDIIVISDQHLLDIIDGMDKKNSNFITAAMVLLYTGLRPGEILSIDFKDIDLKKKSLRYYSAKRKMYRTVPFHNNLLPVLKSRLAEVKSGKLVGYTTSQILGRAVTTYFKQIKIDGNNYVAYSFRKTFITRCRTHFNLDESIVQELVGQAPRTVADKYYNKISIDILREALNKFKLPARPRKTKKKTSR